MNNGVRNVFKALLALFVISMLLTGLMELFEYIGRVYGPYAQ